MSFLFFSFISNPYAARQSSRKHNIRPSKGRSRSYPDFGPRSHPDDCRPSTPQIVHASCCRFMGRSPEGYDDVVMEVESKELLFSDREEAEVRDERHRERQRCRPKNRHARSQSRRLGLSASVAKHTSLSLSQSLCVCVCAVVSELNRGTEGQMVLDLTNLNVGPWL